MFAGAKAVLVYTAMGVLQYHVGIWLVAASLVKRVRLQREEIVKKIILSKLTDLFSVLFNSKVINTRIIHQRVHVIGRFLVSINNDSEVLSEAKRELSTPIKVFSSPAVPCGVITRRLSCAYICSKKLMC